MEQFDALKNKLDEFYTWPTVYTYKFIIPNDLEKLAHVRTMFREPIEVTKKESSSQKYISITIKVIMMSSDEVISKYKSAGEIEGCIAL